MPGARQTRLLKRERLRPASSMSRPRHNGDGEPVRKRTKLHTRSSARQPVLLKRQRSVRPKRLRITPLPSVSRLNSTLARV